MACLKQQQFILELKIMYSTKKLHINQTGRDFVVGDIHGAFDLVLRAMDEINFDPARDRLFSVGDLIDRGPESHRCAKFLAQPYVHAVRGNHEDMLIELYADGEPPQEVLDWMAARNGLGWWNDASPEIRQDVLDSIRRLPLAIEVATSRGSVGLVHADIPAGMDWDGFLSAIEAGEKGVIETALWGRDRIHAGNTSGVPGVGRIFVGHTPQWGGLRRFGNVYAIDTGAIFGMLDIRNDGRLTLVNVLAQTEELTLPKPASLIDVRNQDAAPGSPFGSYVLLEYLGQQASHSRG